MPHFSLRFLVCAGVLGTGLVALGADAVGQQPPDDEPMPPAMGSPQPPPPSPPPYTAPSAPPAAGPPPAATAPPPPPPAAAPAWPPPARQAWPVTPSPRRVVAPPSGTAAGVQATYAPAPASAAAPPAADPDSYLTSLTGAIGLYHISTAEVGPTGHLRFGLHGQYFQSTGFLIQEPDGSTDTNTRFGGTFTFGFTPHESIELYGAIVSSS